MQLIVTTQSDILVDALTDTPEAILVCEKQAGSTTMKRLKREELTGWLDKYLLSIPGMRESIRKGLKTPVEKCSEKPGW